MTGFDRAAVERLLYRECRLLDAGDYDAWLDLYTEDCLYWVPAAWGQADATGHISLYREDRTLMQTRIRRLRHPRAFSQEQPSRTSHVLGNVEIDPAGDGSGELVAQAAFHMLEFHRDEQRLLGGRVTYRLRGPDPGWKIRLKRVDLINCDGVHDALEVFL